MATTSSWTDHAHVVAGKKLHFARSGKGAPVLVLHHDIGTVERLAFYDALAKSFDVIVPHHLGWGRSERPEWMRHPRDLAVSYRGLLSELGINKASLVGLGFGGWIAAEMASMAPADLGKLILVGPMGIKPPEGDILDQAIVSYIDYARAGFHDQSAFEKVYGNVTTDQLEAWDIAREMCFRIAWKPYMYSQTLPHLLGAVKAPSLIVWGAEDKIVPVGTAQSFKASLGNAKVEIIKGCGHCVDMEQPAVLAKLATEFLNVK